MGDSRTRHGAGPVLPTTDPLGGQGPPSEVNPLSTNPLVDGGEEQYTSRADGTNRSEACICLYVSTAVGLRVIKIVQIRTPPPPKSLSSGEHRRGRPVSYRVRGQGPCRFGSEPVLIPLGPILVPSCTREDLVSLGSSTVGLLPTQGSESGRRVPPSDPDVYWQRGGGRSVVGS